jgi:transcription antitermination factor NusG
MNEKKWFALYTRARWEKKVSEILTRRKIENYCPINKVVRQWSDRKKIVQEPLFTSYVFVRASDFDVKLLKQVQGVINFVYWLGKPAVVRDSEIDAIRDFLAEHVNIRLKKTPINANDTVQVLRGPLMDLEGQVITVKSRTVKIALPSLGYLMFAEVETENVKVISHVMPPAVNMHYPLYAIR